jgi:Kef-type K+ transport system membrane component KefB
MNSNTWEHITQQFQLPLANPVLIFFMVLFIILIAPAAMKLIKAPAIVGFIISGIVIGPHGVNLLKKNSVVELFFTIGLLYIMFLAGVEMDLTEFKTKKHKSYVFGALTFFIPIIIGFPVCYYLLGYSFLTSTLTSSMFATHTLVAYPIVSRYGIAKNEAVAVAVGGTIITDTAVLIILAIIMKANDGQLNIAFWVTLIASLLVFTLIMFTIVPKVAKWFLNINATDGKSHYVFVLAVIFFAGFLSQLAGVEPIIGAFVAGLALNKLIPPKSILMNRVDFVGNAVFIPIFLISVGMLVDLRVLLKGPQALIVAFCLTVVALIGKWVAAIITQKTFKYTPVQGRLIFGLSASHAAATLAIILVGFKAHLIDENILNGTIILILVTCVVASFVTERASKKIVDPKQHRDDVFEDGTTLSHN